MVIRVLDLILGSGSLDKALICWLGAFTVTQLELDPDHATQLFIDPPDALERHVFVDALK